jgi:hypothetical protein
MRFIRSKRGSVKLFGKLIKQKLVSSQNLKLFGKPIKQKLVSSQKLSFFGDTEHTFLLILVSKQIT